MFTNVTKQILTFHIFSDLSETFTNVTKQIQAFPHFSDLSQTFNTLRSKSKMFHLFSDLSQTFTKVMKQNVWLKSLKWGKVWICFVKFVKRLT